MLETRSPVGEIAAQLGFASGSHFSQAFARHWGMTPLRWRQQH
ncbi:helix-turn-helix domain-containing protein [Acidovorax cavernicola]